MRNLDNLRNFFSKKLPNVFFHQLKGIGRFFLFVWNWHTYFRYKNTLSILRVRQDLSECIWQKPKLLTSPKPNRADHHDLANSISQQIWDFKIWNENQTMYIFINLKLSTFQRSQMNPASVKGIKMKKSNSQKKNQTMFWIICIGLYWHNLNTLN